MLHLRAPGALRCAGKTGNTSSRKTRSFLVIGWLPLFWNPVSTQWKRYYKDTLSYYPRHVTKQAVPLRKSRHTVQTAWISSVSVSARPLINPYRWESRCCQWDISNGSFSPGGGGSTKCVDSVVILSEALVAVSTHQNTTLVWVFTKHRLCLQWNLSTMALFQSIIAILVIPRHPSVST